jgi:site-specific DNA-methyltransferase (adenine-specific)
MILALKKPGAMAYFDKDAIREPYDQATQARYLKDKRYKNLSARREHLLKGKYATNVWRVPSLKGTSLEKCGHPAQKPEEIMRRLFCRPARRVIWLLIRSRAVERLAPSAKSCCGAL